MERTRPDSPAWVPELGIPDALRAKCARMASDGDASTTTTLGLRDEAAGRDDAGANRGGRFFPAGGAE